MSLYLLAKNAVTEFIVECEKASDWIVNNSYEVSYPVSDAGNDGGLQAEVGRGVDVGLQCPRDVSAK
jgi:hypothetical protein